MARRPRTALIIPTLNEEASIGSTLSEVPRDEIDRMIVADSGSSDRTAEIARANGAEVLVTGRGFGRACLEAVLQAEDADIVVFMDGDGADDPALIGDLLAPLRAGTADFVIGSRTLGSREPGSMSWHQVAAGLAAGWGMALLYGVRFTDMCTFRAIRRRTLIDLGMRELTYGWNIEMQMRVARAGLRVVEIPARCRCRRGGESKVAGNLGTTIRAGSRIVATFMRVALQPALPVTTATRN